VEQFGLYTVRFKNCSQMINSNESFKAASNSLAYYSIALISAVKCFKVHATEEKEKKHNPNLLLT
jgi:hypothetical protein